MRQGVQTILGEAGEAACYLFALGNVAEEYLHQELNPWDVIRIGIDKKLVHYNQNDPNDNDNFYVDDPAGLLEALTGIPWQVRHDSADYIPKSWEYTIQRWERVRTGQTIAHFRRMTWDSLVDSATVRYGKIASQRICIPAGGGKS